MIDKMAAFDLLRFYDVNVRFQNGPRAGVIATEFIGIVMCRVYNTKHYILKTG